MPHGDNAAQHQALIAHWHQVDPTLLPNVVEAAVVLGAVGQPCRGRTLPGKVNEGGDDGPYPKCIVSDGRRRTRPSTTSGSSCRHYEVLRNAPHASTSGVGKARDRLTRPLALEDNAPSPPPPKYRPNMVRQVMELDDIDEADNDYIPRSATSTGHYSTPTHSRSGSNRDQHAQHVPTFPFAPG